MKKKKGKTTTTMTTITMYENKQKKVLPGHIHHRKALRRRLLFHICKGTETGIDSKRDTVWEVAQFSMFFRDSQYKGEKKSEWTGRKKAKQGNRIGETIALSRLNKERKFSRLLKPNSLNISLNNLCLISTCRPLVPRKRNSDKKMPYPVKFPILLAPYV